MNKFISKKNSPINSKNTIAKENRLVLGSAGKIIPDAITLDIDPLHKPDVVHDLNRTPFPFKENQFQEIICHHVLEHLNDLPPVMNELYRICHPTGTIYIETPHHSSWFSHTPEHKLFFNYFAFDGYLDDGRTHWITGKKFRLLKREITFHKAIRRFFLHKLFNRSPLTYERFWTYIFPAEHFKIWLSPIK